MHTRKKPISSRKRKKDLIAPACRAGCQVAHPIEEVAALMSLSISQVERLIKAGVLPVMNCGLGQRKRVLRIPHSAIRVLAEEAKS